MISARERFLEALFESATDYAIIAMDLDGLVISWNEGARRILGWTEDEMVGLPASVFFTIEDRRHGIPQSEMQAALEKGRGSDERWHQRKDGTRFWANGEMMPLRDEHGAVQGFIKILRDRTVQRNAAEAQRADAEFLRGVLGSSGDCIKVLDLDGNILFMNENGLQLMEISDFNAVRGCPWIGFWRNGSDDEARVAIEAAMAVARGGGMGEFQGPANTFAGTPKWWDVRVTPIPGQDGTPEKLLAVARDMTGTRQTEQELAVSEARLSLALDAAGMVGTWDWDLTTDLMYSDANMARIYGVDPAVAARGAPTSAFLVNVPPEDMAGIEAALARLFAAESADDYAYEHRLVDADGAVHWVLARGRLVRDTHGVAVRFPGASVDITERKEAEERQRLLMQELAHRVKNTLAVVLGMTSQTLRGTGPVADMREALTARLLALAQAHDVLMQGSWTEASLRALVEGAAALHGQGDPARLRVDGPDVTLGPQAALSFALVLHELATNAVKYGALSTTEGHISVRWWLEETKTEPHLRFLWQETEGPIVTPPTRQGFGTRLIERSLAQGLGATVELAYPATGVVFRLNTPLASLR
ncbi:PAS domain S-box protein [Acidisoma cladoniae]|uniref:PAS domain S-box protein n=1 Tax=Acidisoma cladoniae TaxID=3040935 RepID=UPI00254A73F6|nr:PAS domain S-box protein [Acidisoma sp. PAMC 29798]